MKKLSLVLCSMVFLGGYAGYPVLAQQNSADLEIPQIAFFEDTAEIIVEQPAPETTALSIEQPPASTYDRCAGADVATMPECDPQVVLISPIDPLPLDGNLTLETGGAYIRLGGAQEVRDTGQSIGAIVVTTETLSPPVAVPEIPAPVIVESTVPFVVESVQ